MLNKYIWNGHNITDLSRNAWRDSGRMGNCRQFSESTNLADVKDWIGLPVAMMLGLSKSDMS